MADAGADYLKRLLVTFRRGLGEVDEGVNQVGKEQDGDGGGGVGGDGKEVAGDGGSLEKVREEMRKLEDWLREEWGWELGDEYVRKGMVQLEDGEQVELEMDELEAEDERGEYAPVVVHLDEEAT